MRVDTQEVRHVTSMLDEIVKKYKEEHPARERDWRTYEQRVVKRLKTAFRELRPLVEEAAASVHFVSGETRGAKPALTVEQRVLALLIKHIIGKSNRNMAAMFTVFSLLSDVDVSYKTVERFYSDPEVAAVLHNLHALLLRKKGVKSIDGSGDGTGYSLSIKVHYASAAQRLKDKVKREEEREHQKRLFVYSFALLDLESRMYIGTGTSFRSEKEAYTSAIAMARATGIAMASLRLDRYYSNQSDVENLVAQFGKIELYLIPKSNATVEGPWQWKRTLFRFITDVKAYLEEYYRRNQSESCFAEDKRRTGWNLGQKRPDRINTANFLTTIWHNLYWQC